MKVVIISYSLTGNNDNLAMHIAKRIHAEHIKVIELKKRTITTIVFDVILNRTPKVELKMKDVEPDTMVIFMGPIWMGKVAAPLRAYFKKLKSSLGKYAFISISGGSITENTSLESDLMQRLGKMPSAVIDLHITSLLPSNPKPGIKEVSSYRLTEHDLIKLTEKAMDILNKVVH